jgi:hypothetical protein
MGELDGTFRLLDELDPPDVWEEIIEREPRPRPMSSLGHRLIAAAVALAVFAVGSFVTWTAFRPSDMESTPVDRTGEPAYSDACGEPTTRATITLSEAIAFDTGCLAVPAARPLTLEFRNAAPSVQATLSIYQAASLAQAHECTDPACPAGPEPLFQGGIVVGPDRIVYDVPGLPAGMYTLQDDVHPAANVQVLVVPTADVDALVEIDDGYRVYSDVFDMGPSGLLAWELVLLRTDETSRLCDGTGLALAYRDDHSTDWQSCPEPFFWYEVFLGEGTDVLVVGALDPRVDAIRIEGDAGRAAEGLIFPLSTQVGTGYDAYVIDASSVYPGTLTALDADGDVLQERELVDPKFPGIDEASPT